MTPAWGMGGEGVTLLWEIGHHSSPYHFAGLNSLVLPTSSRPCLQHLLDFLFMWTLAISLTRGHRFGPECIRLTQLSQPKTAGLAGLAGKFRTSTVAFELWTLIFSVANYCISESFGRLDLKQRKRYIIFEEFYSGYEILLKTSPKAKKFWRSMLFFYCLLKKFNPFAQSFWANWYQILPPLFCLWSLF